MSGDEEVGLPGAGRAPGPLSFFPVLLEAREGACLGPRGLPACLDFCRERAGAGRHGDTSQDREEQGSNWSLESWDPCRGKGQHATAFPWT